MNDWKRLRETIRELRDAALARPFSDIDIIGAGWAYLERHENPIPDALRRDMQVVGVPVRLQMTHTVLGEARDAAFKPIQVLHFSIGSRDGTVLPPALVLRARLAFEEAGGKEAEEFASAHRPGTVRQFLLVNPHRTAPPAAGTA